MITAQQMRELESKSGIPSVTLMERAGKAFVSALKESVEVKNKKILVACYHGKNGGDGFVIADLLSSDTEVDLLFIGDEEKMPKESAHFFLHVNNNPAVQFVTLETADLDDYDVLIDALLGINIHNYLKPEIALTIKLINEAKGFIVAVDIPTGYNPDTGAVVDQGINADLIITFHDMKPGLEQFKDKVKVVSIGL